MSNSASRGAREPANAEDMTVLVVDDERVVAEQLAQGLTAYGLPADFVENAQDALSRLATDPFIGVVVTDIRMPGQDGLGLAQAILSQRKDAAAVEVIMITGHATIEDATAAVRTGVADFLRKPFRLAEAFEAVSKARARAATRRQSARSRAAEATRLADLEQERLALQGRMAELGRLVASQPPPAGAAAAIERDMSAISHALRTPLIAISGGAELLAHGGLPENDEAEYRDMLRNGVERVVQAVELVEELHRLERPVANEAPSRLAVADLLRAALAQTRASAEAKHLRMGAQPDLPDIRVEGHATRLRRAVEHCAAAAVDWVAEGGDVLAQLEPGQDASGSWAVLTFLAGPANGLEAPPAGIGFDEAGSAHARTQESLRFAIARRIAEQHGGRLTSWNGGPGRMAIRLGLRV
jgi:FixJ family two-component response regulator